MHGCTLPLQDLSHDHSSHLSEDPRLPPRRRQTRNQPQGADRLEASKFGKVPIDRLAEIAPKARISRARVVDAGRIITAGGIASGMEMGFHLLRRAGSDEALIGDVARVMEYKAAYDLYRDDVEYCA
jgi:hypothetical protein